MSSTKHQQVSQAPTNPRAGERKRGFDVQRQGTAGRPSVYRIAVPSPAKVTSTKRNVA